MPLLKNFERAERERERDLEQLRLLKLGLDSYSIAKKGIYI